MTILSTATEPDSVNENLAATFQDESIHDKWESVYRGNPRQDRLNDYMLEQLLRQCDIPRGGTVLDAGCGIGDHTFRLAKHGFSCTGVDVSEPMLQQARQTAERESRSIEFVNASLEHLELGRTFDLVHCRGVLMHIPNWRAALASLCRHVAKDGTIMVWENNHRSMEMSIVQTLGIFRKPSRRRVTTIDGIEFHDEKDGFAPLTRVANLATLQREIEHSGLTVFERKTTEFFDINRFPEGFARNQAIHLNSLAFRMPGTRGLACGNVLLGRRS